MQSRQFSIKHFIYKACIFIAIFYALVLATSLLISAYLFLNLGHYKTRIEKSIFTHTGYTVLIGNIDSGLSNYYLPQLTLTNAKLTNPSNSAQSFAIKNLQLVISLSSIWHLEPIFNQINISGTDLNFEYLPDGKLILNGINLNHQAPTTSSKKPLDLESWLLKQKQIHLSAINISFLDKKHNLPKFQLYNVETILSSKAKNKHELILNLGRDRDSQNQMLGAKLDWNGGKFSEFNHWHEANFKVQSFNNRVDHSISHYIPGANLINKFNADTAIEGQIKNGQLQFFYANFDINNFHYAISHGKNMINFPQVGGSIKINLTSANHYTLQATNLNIATPDGNILANKNIVGNYTVGNKGDLSITSTDLKSLNNLLSMFPNIDKMSLSGTLDIVTLDWLGTILHPSSYNIFASFNNLAITSKNLDIPSINNVSGSLTITPRHGTINLSLRNSTLLYPHMFLIPYKFKNLDSKINWQLNKDKTIDVILDKTTFATSDFSGFASGKYTYVPKTSGYLSLNAHVNKVKTSKVGDYLPIIIGMPVHKWLNAGLIGGYGQNADLVLKGWLDNFPFTDGNGMFYITADINDGQLKYVEDWPTLDNIKGQFQIRNQKIIILADSAKVYGNTINKATVIIPDMTAHDHVYLTADGNASGTTANFMSYLSQTPINKIIGGIPEKVTTNGNGNLEIHLNVPFSDPVKTKVNGTYEFLNNDLQFHLPLPLFTQVNGKLLFSNKGIEIDNITEKTLNSSATLSATTATNGEIHFNIFSPNLHYNDVVGYYLPFLQPVISGQAPTTITFDIAKGGISQIAANSNLRGVTIDTPQPTGKESNSISSLHFVMQPDHSTSEFNINYDYAGQLHGHTQLDAHGKHKHTDIAVGTDLFSNKLLNQPNILIAINTPNISIIDWFETVTKVLHPQNKSESATKPDDIVKINTHKKTEHGNILPLEILVNTSNIMLGTKNLLATTADVLVLNDRTLFNLNSTLSNGFGTYVYSTKQLNIMMNEFNILEAITDIKQPSVKKSPNLNVNTELVKLNQTPAYHESSVQYIAQFESSQTKHIDKTLDSNNTTAPNGFPNINLTVNDLFYENIRVAKLSTQLKTVGNDVIIESSQIIGSVTETNFHGINHCMACSSSKAFVEMVVNIKIKDLGQLLDRLGYKQMIAKGNGSINVNLQWDGKLQSFNLSHTIATINVDLKNGKFLKVSTGSVFGEILGIINLQSITNFTHLDFSEAFSNGFYFDTLKVRAYLLNNKLDIKSSYMTGPLATVRSYGVIDINNDQLDTYLFITPKLGAGIAIGAAVATVNPIVGIVTYAAELILGEPFSKLFTFGYHITGPIKKPTLQKTAVSQQVIDNLNSAIGVSK